MISQEEARSRVARGAAHLDVVRPGWFNRIDVGTLTLHEPCGCIVGQLCGVYTARRVALMFPSQPADWMSDAMEREQIARGAYYGLNRLWEDDANGGGRSAYRLLQDAWIEAIADRRLATQPTVADIPSTVMVTR